MNNLLSLNSRKIFLNDIDLILNVDTIEFPDQKIIDPIQKSLRTEFEGINFDDRLYNDCVNTIGGTKSSIITFDKWNTILNTTLETLNKASFKEQIPKIYAGASKEKKEYIEEWLEKTNSYLVNSSSSYSNSASFIDGGLRHYLLNPTALSNNVLSGNQFLDYTGEPSLLQSVFWDLRNAGFTELEILNWNRLTKSLNSSILPTSKELYELVMSYEIPFAGSPEIKPLSIAAFRNYCRGAAFVMLSSSVYNSAEALGQKDIHSLVFYLIGGGIATLAFISIGPIATRLEDYLKRKNNIDEKI